MNSKKTVFLTGAAGELGVETVREFLKHADRFQLRISDLPTERNQERLKEFQGNKSVDFIWGDLRDYEVILKGVTGADYVLCVGVFNSPFCDDFPEDALITNYGSTLSMLRAIKAQKEPDRIRIVNIGSVAMTGDRMPPIHWGRVGDPLKPSIYDAYALGKVASERAVIESGLKHWVSLRQTAQLPYNPLGGGFAIISHNPMNCCWEHISKYDTARLMRLVCEDNVPEDFWRRIYNIGGGESFRKTTAEMAYDIYDSFGVDLRQVMEPNWSARFNFHGHWFLDSDILDNILHYRQQSFEDYKTVQGAIDYENFMKNPVPIPSAEQIRENNRMIISGKFGGVLNFVQNNDIERINVWFGSKAYYDSIPGWDKFITYRPVGKPIVFNHGYDETKPASELDLADMKGVAGFRGGRCLSQGMNKGDLYAALEWRCAFGHQFKAMPFTVLKGGHWCDQCNRGHYNYGEIAKVNPFFAQVWNPLHGPEETYKVKMLADDSIVHHLRDVKHGIGF